VPDDGGALHADGGEQVADAGGVRAEGVVPARRGGVAVSDEVGRDDHVVAARLAATDCQWLEELSMPWMSTIGSPLPATR